MSIFLFIFHNDTLKKVIARFFYGIIYFFAWINLLNILWKNVKCLKIKYFTRYFLFWYILTHKIFIFQTPYSYFYTQNLQKNLFMKKKYIIWFQKNIWLKKQNLIAHFWRIFVLTCIDKINTKTLLYFLFVHFFLSSTEQVEFIPITSQCTYI